MLDSKIIVFLFLHHGAQSLVFIVETCLVPVYNMELKNFKLVQTADFTYSPNNLSQTVFSHVGEINVLLNLLMLLHFLCLLERKFILLVTRKSVEASSFVLLLC